MSRKRGWKQQGDEAAAEVERAEKDLLRAERRLERARAEVARLKAEARAILGIEDDDVDADLAP